ncbi:hypothetical protein [Pseudoxanthomonas composti]|nr:hypothetical protein [Pseudoxanthomonas composti]
MGKWLYVLYAIVVILIVATAAKRSDRTWGGSASGHSGWSSGGGHK